MYISKIANNFLIIIVFILSITSCTKQQDNILGSNTPSSICIYLDGGDLKYNTDIPIAGFQFNHNGCITGASGGDAASSDFTLSSSETAVLGFSFSGSTIPVGSGTLISLEGDISLDCMSQFVFSDSEGGSIDIEISDTPCTTLSLMTWNIENFPKSGLATIEHVSRIIKEYNPDIIALQEMPDDIDHEGVTLLRNELPEYNIILGNSSFATLGFLYKENSLLEYVGYFNMVDEIDIDEINGLDVGYVFVRDPLGLHMKWHGEDIYIINNHFKCCGDNIIESGMLYECDEDEKRYIEASDCTSNCSSGDCFGTFDENYRRFLSSKVIQQQYSNTDMKVIFLGDLNDEITDDDEQNVFIDLLEDDSFTFADTGIAEGLSDYWSYPSYPSHIDHILLTSNLNNSFNQFQSHIYVPTIDLDFMNWEQYDFLVSDHRPVILNLAY